MQFDRNVTEFPTMLHRDLYMRALRLVPPDVSLAEIEKTDPEMAASGREYYHFMLELLGDMYCNPELYGMTPGAYENFADGRKWRYMRLRVNDFGDYYDLSGAQISSYLRFIQEIALHGSIADGQCYLTYDDFEKVKDLKRVTPVKGQHLLIPIETVMRTLERSGLHYRDCGDRIQVISEKYPNLFLSASALAKAVEETILHPVSKKLKYYFGEYIDTLEFRLLQGIYYPDFEDHIRSLSDQNRELVKALDAMAKEMGLRPNYKDSLEYKYKSKDVMGVGTNNDAWFTEPSKKRNLWTRHVLVSIRGSERPEYLQRVSELGEDFVKYFNRHLNYCSGCTPYHLENMGGIRYILGRKVRLCSPSVGGVIGDLSASDLPYIKKYIELRMQEIAEGF